QQKNLACGTLEKVDQAPEQARTEAIHLHRAARAACLPAHFCQNVRREDDTEYAAGRGVVTHFRWTPWRISSWKRAGSVLKLGPGMICRGSQCFQCRKTRTS